MWYQLTDTTASLSSSLLLSFTDSGLHVSLRFPAHRSSSSLGLAPLRALELCLIQTQLLGTPRSPDRHGILRGPQAPPS